MYGNVGHTVSDYSNVFRVGNMGQRVPDYGRVVNLGIVVRTVSDIIMLSMW
jgi:hypothetical protein